MRTIGFITALSGIALLTACASTTPASQINENNVQITGFSKADEASLKDQLTQELKRELAKINTPVAITNITSTQELTRNADGKTHQVLVVKTADGKTYHSRPISTPLSAEQKARLSKLKGATLRGVIAIQDRPNEYFFSVIENPVY